MEGFIPILIVIGVVISIVSTFAKAAKQQAKQQNHQEEPNPQQRPAQYPQQRPAQYPQQRPAQYPQQRPAQYQQQARPAEGQTNGPSMRAEDMRPESMQTESERRAIMPKQTLERTQPMQKSNMHKNIPQSKHAQTVVPAEGYSARPPISPSVPTAAGGVVAEASAQKPAGSPEGARKLIAQIQKQPPLVQGMIFAEILGKPKCVQ